MKLLTSLFCLCVLLPASATAEIQTQYAFDTSIKIKWFEPLWHLRLRTKPEGGGLFQIRTGPIFAFDLNDRVTLMAGAYFTREQNEDRWTTINRPFAGGEVMIWGRFIEADWRSLIERFVVSNEPDYLRFRSRFRISPRHPRRSAAPYAGVEVFADVKGFQSTRYSAGLRRTFFETLHIDLGYFFEDRGPNPLGERHAFITSIHWRNKTRRIDPDF